MANVIPFAFRGELFSGTHNFSSGDNQFKIALYTAGGEVLGSQAVAASTAVASVDFGDATWSSATFTAAFAAIYNSTNSDKLCVVLDFGGNKTATNGTFKITFPDPSTPANAIISMA
mgnify:CR=1 FL=1